MESTVRNWLRSEGVAEEPGIDLYLFGSVLASSNPKDVDLVVVYDTEQVDIQRAIGIRMHLQDAILKVTGIRGDIVLLSTREVKQTQFLERVGAIHLTQTGQ